MGAADSRRGGWVWGANCHRARRRRRVVSLVGRAVDSVADYGKLALHCTPHTIVEGMGAEAILDHYGVDLADTVRPILGLRQIARGPIELCKDDRVGCCQRKPDSSLGCAAFELRLGVRF